MCGNNLQESTGFQTFSYTVQGQTLFEQILYKQHNLIKIPDNTQKGVESHDFQYRLQTSNHKEKED